MITCTNCKAVLPDDQSEGRPSCPNCGSRKITVSATGSAVVIPGASTTANAFNLFVSSFTHPLNPTVIEPNWRAGGGDAGAPVTRDLAQRSSKPQRTPIVGSPHFKLVLLIVTSIAAVCLAGQVAMALVLSEPHTAMQQAVFDRMSWGWTGGFGALLGLLGGKVIR
jgi:RNA polymerase subunit RPABC4/transcription elongation factor Spt4